MVKKFSAGDKVRIQKHEQRKYVGKSGRVVSVASARIAKPASSHGDVCMVRIEGTSLDIPCSEEQLQYLTNEE